MRCGDWTCKYNSMRAESKPIGFCELHISDIEINEFHECETYEQEEQ